MEHLIPRNLLGGQRNCFEAEAQLLHTETSSNILAPTQCLFRLCRPNPLDRLRHTNVVRLKLVQTHSSGQSEPTQQPVERRPRLGNPSGGEVINNRGPDEGDTIVSQPDDPPSTKSMQPVGVGRGGKLTGSQRESEPPADRTVRRP